MNERILSPQLLKLVQAAGTGYSQTNPEWIEKFAELIVSDYAKQLVQANMTNHWYVRAMDEYYENKWAHRFD